MNGLLGKILGDIPAILGGDKEKLIKDAEEFGRHLAENKLSTSQIRNIFNEIKRMRRYEESKNDLLLLKPKLAYTAGRHGKMQQGKLVGPVPDLSRVLTACIDNVKDSTSFENFKDFFEAILAYHRYYGGKE